MGGTTFWCIDFRLGFLSSVHFSLPFDVTSGQLAS